MTLWPAPRRRTPLDAVIELPGSKSLTNRELVLSALAEGPSRLRRPLASRDSELMIAALRALGAVIEPFDDGLQVHPMVPGAALDARIECGLAGTVMRFVPALAALVSGAVTFDGDPRARERPMGGTLGALRALGVEIDDGGRGALPFTVHGRGAVAGGPVRIDASGSSQFVSALLLAGPRFTEGVGVHHSGERLPSTAHIAMTLRTLAERGVRAEPIAPTAWRVHPGPIAGREVTIEPDLSNAGPFVAAALVVGGRVRVRDWPVETTQAGDAWRELAARFGARVERDGADLVVTARRRPRAIDVDLGDVGELTPVVAAVCAVAKRPSRLRGIAHLRGHETDRLAALATEIGRMGAQVDQTADGLVIRPRPLHGTSFATYDDHRMAHTAAVLGLVVDDVRVENIATTAKTYPQFAADWERFSA